MGNQNQMCKSAYNKQDLTATVNVDDQSCFVVCFAAVVQETWKNKMLSEIANATWYLSWKPGCLCQKVNRAFSKNSQMHI